MTLKNDVDARYGDAYNWLYQNGPTTEMKMFEVDRIGSDDTATSYDIRTRGGCFAGIVTVKNDGTAKVYFNSTATRGSTRKFVGLAGALNYIYDRRVKKGWKI